VFLPNNADGSKIQQLAAVFPNGPRDDVDAASQFLNWRRNRGGGLYQWLVDMAAKTAGERA
jgi:hypothetical protein